MNIYVCALLYTPFLKFVKFLWEGKIIFNG